MTLENSVEKFRIKMKRHQRIETTNGMELSALFYTTFQQSKLVTKLFLEHNTLGKRKLRNKRQKPLKEDCVHGKDCINDVERKVMRAIEENF